MHLSVNDAFKNNNMHKGISSFQNLGVIQVTMGWKTYDL
jgi:peptide subunit release factor RF-3